MIEKNNRESYNPSWLVELAREQYPDDEWLHKALTDCTLGRRHSEAYIYFVNRDEWQFKTNITLHSETHGLIVLDVLKDHRIGGIEFTFYIGPRLICPCGFVYDYPSMVSYNWQAIHGTRQQEYKEIERKLTLSDKEQDKQEAKQKGID